VCAVSDDLDSLIGLILVSSPEHWWLKPFAGPHKFKGGVSGCVRECAEAQSKDFGLIATDKGWNSEYYAGRSGEPGSLAQTICAGIHTDGEQSSSAVTAVRSHDTPNCSLRTCRLQRSSASLTVM
jgi:hypothetical protein